MASPGETSALARNDRPAIRRLAVGTDDGPSGRGAVLMGEDYDGRHYVLGWNYEGRTPAGQLPEGDVLILDPSEGE